MTSLRSWIIPIATILSLLLVIFGGLWSQRPIIEYTLSNHPETFDSQVESMRVGLLIKNVGKSYANLNLVLTVENGNISLSKLEKFMIYNGTQLKIHFDLPSEMETYNEHYVDIDPTDTPENFTVSLEIENLADLSVPNGIISQFLEPHGYISHLVYSRTDTTTYELIP